MEQAKFQPTLYTPAEYFALEAQSLERHEYFEGEIFVVSGESKLHNRLVMKLLTHTLAQVSVPDCQVFAITVRLVAEEGRHYTYPDLMLGCDPADQADEYCMRHPLLLAEVLSPRTEDYDRRLKFQQCQKLPGLRHYLLVSQNWCCVEWYRRNEAGEWVITILNKAADVLEINDLGLRVPLAELYNGTDVPFSDGRPRTAAG